VLIFKFAFPALHFWARESLKVYAFQSGAGSGVPGIKCLIGNCGWLER
jgi:hypothetical protein